MRSYKSTIKVGDKVVPFLIHEYETLDEAISRRGHIKVLSLINYAFALYQRAEERAKINKSGNLRGMCRTVKADHTERGYCPVCKSPACVVYP
ncbi:hypothetical protein LCGC14_2643640 [marine sediment metagenome]|uniref:Uncharacterized protein n=1 Tax=marine sediment metagenome TaxID=412755 RepID=A0A0F8ZWY1_9ZZZZ